MAHAWNSIGGTWHGLPVPPGRRSVCSQAFLGVPCHFESAAHVVSPEEFLAGAKLGAVPVSKSSWAWLVPEPGAGLSVCVCVWEETAQGRTKLNSMKNSCLELHSTGRVLWIAYENRWIFFFTEKIVLGASSLHGSICEFTLDHGSGHEGKKVMGYFHSVSPQLVPSAFLCSFIFPTASRAFL